MKKNLNEIESLRRELRCLAEKKALLIQQF